MPGTRWVREEDGEKVGDEVEGRVTEGRMGAGVPMFPSRTSSGSGESKGEREKERKKERMRETERERERQREAERQR